MFFSVISGVLFHSQLLPYESFKLTLLHKNKCLTLLTHEHPCFNKEMNALLINGLAIKFYDS